MILVTYMGGLGFIVPARPAETGTLNWDLGAEYTTGDYGTSGTTEIWYFPLTLSYDLDRTTIGAETSLIIVDGTGEVQVTGGDGGGHHTVITTTTDTRRETNDGLGDVLLWVRYALMEETGDRPSVDGIVQVKLPTASESDNLGTGETDFKLQIDLAKSHEWGYLFGAIGIKLLGDPPNQDFDDPLFCNIGSQISLADEKSISIVWDWAEASSPSGSNISEITLYYNTRLNNNRSIQPYMLLGLDDGSPDFGIGVSLPISRW